MIRIEAPQPATNYRTGNGLPATGYRQPATAIGYVTAASQ